MLRPPLARSARPSAPDPDQARSWLERELRAAGVPARPARAVRCPGSRDLWDAADRRAGGASPLSDRRGDRAAGAAGPRAARRGRGPAAARAGARAATARGAACAATLRRTSTGPRAEAALAEGRFDDALVEAFRALAVAAARARPRRGPARADRARARRRPGRRLPRPHASTWPARPASSTWCSTATSRRPPTTRRACSPRRGAAHGPAGEPRRHRRRGPVRRCRGDRPWPGCAPTGAASPWSASVAARRWSCSGAAHRRLARPRGGDLDPDNPGADGAQAVARVLADHGVEVTVVRRAAALGATRPSTRTPRCWSPRRDHLGRAPPGRWARAPTAAGAARARRARADRGPTRSGCRSTCRRGARGATAPTAGCADDLLAGLDRRRRAVGRATAARPHRSTGCFGGAGERRLALVARVDRASRRTPSARPTCSPTTRSRDADNAAVALRLLGQHDRLVWYVPDRRDVSAGDDGVSLRALLPRVAAARPCGWSRSPCSRCCCGAAAGSARWSSSRCRWWSRPSRPPRAAAGSTAGSGDRAHAAGVLRAAARAPARRAPPARPAAPTRRRSCATVARPPAADPDEVARPARSRRPRPRRRRPDRPGRRPGRARERGTPPMTEPTAPRPSARRTARASGSPRSAPRSPRPWSARTPPSPACSSRCCAAATC